jgi:hypothetical protein
MTAKLSSEMTIQTGLRPRRVARPWVASLPPNVLASK